MSGVELFAGPGGWSVGAALLGMDPDVGIELDATACATATAAGFIRRQLDVTTCDPMDYLESRRLIASPVCTGFSPAGKGQGRLDVPTILEAVDQIARGWHPDQIIKVYTPEFIDPHSRLALEPLRWALAIRPEWMAWEQVPAVLPLWEACAEALRAAGYAVWTGNMKAERYGVPQTRTRAVLIASRVRVVGEPPATHSAYYNRSPEKLDPGMPRWVSMAEALGWGATARPGMTVTGGGANTGGAEPFGHAARSGLLAEAAAGRWEMRSNYTKGGDLSNRNLRPVTAPSFAVTGNIGKNMWQPSDGPGRWVLRGGTGEHATRRELDQPAATVHFGARANTVEFIDTAAAGDVHARGIRITPQEAAVLQSFPPDYPWQGVKTRQYQQIGNAVPPLLAMHILAEASGLPTC